MLVLENGGGDLGRALLSVEFESWKPPSVSAEIFPKELK